MVLFATHFHELVALAERWPLVANFHVTAVEGTARSGAPVFSHRVLPGSTSRSFGIEVARMAGLPSGVVERAREIAAALEERPTRRRAGPAARIARAAGPRRGAVDVRPVSARCCVVTRSRWPACRCGRSSRAARRRRRLRSARDERYARRAEHRGDAPALGDAQTLRPRRRCSASAAPSAATPVGRTVGQVLETDDDRIAARAVDAIEHLGERSDQRGVEVADQLDDQCVLRLRWVARAIGEPDVHRGVSETSVVSDSMRTTAGTVLRLDADHSQPFLRRTVSGPALVPAAAPPARRDPAARRRDDRADRRRRGHRAARSRSSRSSSRTRSTPARRGSTWR